MYVITQIISEMRGKETAHIHRVASQEVGCIGKSSCRRASQAYISSPCFFTIKGSFPACTGGNGNVHVTVYSQLVSPFIYITGNKVGVSSENETFA